MAQPIIHSDKRQHPRIIVDYVTVEVYLSDNHSDAPELSDICSVLNLSENGMLFAAEHAYVPQRLLRLTFSLPETMLIIRTNATVIHTKKSNRKIETGVQFKNLGLAEQRQIQHFVQKHLGLGQEGHGDAA